jgi:hypothetical protein
MRVKFYKIAPVLHSDGTREEVLLIEYTGKSARPSIAWDSKTHRPVPRKLAYGAFHISEVENINDCMNVDQYDTPEDALAMWKVKNVETEDALFSL